MMRRSYRIMEALSAVDEELLARCELDCGCGHKGHGFARGMSAAFGSIWKYAGAWAAVLCFALIGTAGWGAYQLMRGAGGSDSTAGGMDGNGRMQQEMCDMEEAEEMENAADAGICPEEGRILESGVNGNMGDSDGMDGMDRYESLQSGIGEEGNGVESAKNSIENAESDIGGSDALAVGKSGNGGNEIEMDMMEQSSERSAARLLAWEEAQALEGLGGYVPRRLPGGYVFEEAVYYPDARRGLTMHWSRGMDDIVLNIGEGEGAVSAVDVDRPEAYDMRLYEVPYGETVPMEYRETFGDPVFALGDFDLEIVRSRMVSYGDAGDTDTPRGRFSVLYPDGTLVSFNGCGTAEEIWELFRSMEEGAQ